VSEPAPELEWEKFNYKKCLIERWDKPSMIRAFAFVGSLTFFLLLSFIGVATISEAVQILIFGVVMFILIFRYFKELTVGPIASKPNIFLNIGGRSACMDSSSRGEILALPKGDARLEKS
jgi:hypothetical protein